MTCEILISISLGDNFPLKDDYLLKECKTNAILIAKFNDELLQSDPIEIDSINPELATELGFRINRKDFHQFRTERKSIKLQCFVEYSTQQQQQSSSSSLLNDDNNGRHFIGYVVLHLRDAQDYTNEPKYKWVVLLNPKYKGSSNKRPQLYLALMVNKINDNINNTIDNDNEQQLSSSLTSSSSNTTSTIIESTQFTRSIKKEGKSYFLNDSIMNFLSDNSNLSIEITNKCVYIWNKNICEQNDCQQIFTINIHMNRPKNLINLFLQNNDNKKMEKYFFRYVLFGKQIKTNSFMDIINCQDFQQHKYSINIRTFNKDMLKEYFESYPTIEIQFCSSNNELIGFVTINLLKLFQQQNSFIYGNFVIVPEEESVYVKDPFPIINLRLFLLNQNKNETFIERPIDFINHYYIAIDLRTIKLITNNHQSSNNQVFCQILFQPFYLQFSYAFFGATEPIKTYPSIQFLREQPEQEITIPHGFCGFNLATTYEKLLYTFHNLPLIIQLILNEDNTLLGTSEIDLKCLLLQNNNDNNEDDQQQQNSTTTNNTTLNDNFVQIDTTVFDELSDQICELKVIMFIQELIDTVNNDNDDLQQQQSFIQSQQQIKMKPLLLLNNNDRKKPLISKSSIMTQSLYNDMEIFDSTSPTSSTTINQQQLIEKEKQLNLLMKKLDERERLLFEEEKLLDLKKKELLKKNVVERRCYQNNTDTDIDLIINKLQCDYNDKINQFKLKLNQLEQEKLRYQEKSYQLERKMKEKIQRIRDLEAKVFELTQLNKRKQQQQHQPQDVTNPKRSIIIQREYENNNNNNIDTSSSLLILNNQKSNLPIRSKSITRPLCGGNNQSTSTSTTSQNV